jgi:hypothetical protein
MGKAKPVDCWKKINSFAFYKLNNRLAVSDTGTIIKIKAPFETSNPPPLYHQ